MTKAELEKKPLSDLHQLAAEAGIEKFRMLTKGELVERLAEGNGNGAEPSEKPSRQRREPRERKERPRESRERPKAAPERESRPEPVAKPEREPVAKAEPEPAAESPRPRRRRRRRFGRRAKGVTLQTLLLPPEAGRQTLVFAETREGCTALLRGVASDLSADAKGPDPVVLLIDPSPEELADWKRDAPQAEIVSAGQPRHASDALAQAASRSGGGEDVILLVDSLTRLAEAYGDAEAAKEFFDAGREQGSRGGGSLTVVAALERPNGD
ncbi:MAG TPA: Rho termination factor N-terminal domain-containing protein [Solirubrobacterales bacterium]|nr:Rho termination factor N-terminal domain-containing protein [Solirubrobacterales bacterium]